MYKAMIVNLTYRQPGTITRRECFETVSYFLDFVNEEETEKRLMKDVKKIFSLFEKYENDVDFNIESWDANYVTKRIALVEQTYEDLQNDVFTLHSYDSAGNRTEKAAGKKAICNLILETFRQLAAVNDHEAIISA